MVGRVSYRGGRGGRALGFPPRNFNCLNSYNRVYNTITKYNIVAL